MAVLRMKIAREAERVDFHHQNDSVGQVFGRDHLLGPQADARTSSSVIRSYGTAVAPSDRQA
jgi:hypothetical protein